MADNVGIKISKPQFDARSAGDSDLVFSSSWPSLFQIGTYFQYLGGVSSATLTHDAGFAPFTLGWHLFTDGTTVMCFPNVSTTNISLVGGSPNPATFDFVDIVMYNVNLAEDKEYPLIREPSTVSGPYDNNFGIKLMKSAWAPFIDRYADDLNFYLLHSRAQSPMVLAVKTEASAVGQTITYRSPLNETSWVFGYVKQADGTYQVAPYYSQAYPKTTIDPISRTYSITWSGTDIGATLVILRDPMFSGTSIEATY